MKRLAGYALVAVWVALACAAQVSLLAFAPWIDTEGSFLSRALVPDLGICVLVAAVARVGRHDAIGLAISATIGRAAFTGAAPMSVFAGSLAVAMVAGSLGRLAELDRPFLRVASAGLGALLFCTWLLLVDFIRSDEARMRDTLSFGQVGPDHLWVPLLTALTTAMVAFALWPLLRTLPGLRRLERPAF